MFCRVLFLLVCVLCCVSGSRICDSCKAVLYSVKSGVPCAQACSLAWQMKEQLTCEELCHYLGDFILKGAEYPCNGVGVCKDKEMNQGIVVENSVGKVEQRSDIAEEIMDAVDRVEKDIDSLRGEMNVKYDDMDRKLDILIHSEIESQIREPFGKPSRKSEKVERDEEEKTNESRERTYNQNSNRVMNRDSPAKGKKRISFDSDFPILVILFLVVMVVQYLIEKNRRSEREIIGVWESTIATGITILFLVISAFNPNFFQNAHIFKYLRCIIAAYYFFLWTIEYANANGDTGSTIVLAKNLVFVICSLFFDNNEIFIFLYFILKIDNGLMRMSNELELDYPEKMLEFFIIAFQSPILFFCLTLYYTNLSLISNALLTTLILLNIAELSWRLTSESSTLPPPPSPRTTPYRPPRYPKLT